MTTAWPGRTSAAALLLAVLGCTGCFVASANFSREERDIERRTGLTLEADASMGFGSLMLGIARHAVHDDPEASAALQEIRGVEFATYKVSGGDANRAVEAFPAGPEWTPVLRARDRGESAQVLVRQNGEHITKMMIIARDHDELVMVRVEGRLERLLARLESGKNDLHFGGHALSHENPHRVASADGQIAGAADAADGDDRDETSEN